MDPFRRARGVGFVAVVGLSFLMLAGCYHAQVTGKKVNAASGDNHVEGGPEQSKDIHWCFWGLSQPEDQHPDCKGNGLAYVHTVTDVGTAFLTLGIYVTGTLKWACATDRQTEPEFVDPRLLVDPPQHDAGARNPP